MKSRAALLLEAPGRWEVREVDVDPPKDHEVLVRMVASGLCHSDVHYNIGDQATAMPMCGGHEGAGIVEDVGRGVARLKPGDHVVTSFIPSCGHCRYCATGRQNLCQRGGQLQIGPQLDGTYRMHYEGQGVSQFMLISTFSAWAGFTPELKRGWCQYARLQAEGCAARSARSQSSWGEPASQPPTSLQLLLRTTTCHAPAS